MRIISLKALKEFWLKHNDAKEPLKTWYDFAKNAEWEKPQDIKKVFKNVSFVSNNRAIFNIKGNKYRLVVAINYTYKVIYIRFIDTHKQYEKIDVNEV